MGVGGRPSASPMPDRDVTGHRDPSLRHQPGTLSSCSLGACRHFWQQPPSGSSGDPSQPAERGRPPARHHAAPRARNDHAVARAIGSSPARSRPRSTASPSDAPPATASCVARLKPTVAVSSTGTTESTRPAVPRWTSEERGSRCPANRSGRAQREERVRGGPRDRVVTRRLARVHEGGGQVVARPEPLVDGEAEGDRGLVADLHDAGEQTRCA